MAPSGSQIMRNLLILVCFLSIERLLASGTTTGNDQQVLEANSTTRLVTYDKSLPYESTIENSRKSRALPVSENRGTSSETLEDLSPLETNSDYIYPKLYLAKLSEEHRKRDNNAMIPTLRFGRSGTSMIPTIRFGRSGNSMIPTIRFGRSGNSMIPTIRFGRSGNSMIPTIRFGRSGGSMIPTIRFGRSFSQSEELGDNIEDEIHEISGSVIPYPRFGREVGTDSKERISSLEFLNRILKRQSNDSIIPQIRYGRSSLKAKKTEELKPPFFVLPNIRPGRSSNDGLDMKESNSEPYYADLDGFLGLFGAFRRSDAHSVDDSINEMEMGSKVEDILIATDQVNTDSANKELEEQLVKSNKDSLYVIPYPRPGKRRTEKVPTLEKDQSDLLNKISSFMLPYPRPGKRAGNLEYTRTKRSSIPYPRPGRSSSFLPYPRLGRSDSILPYPRLGRSSSVLPYPRPGRSNSVLPYPRLGRSANVLPYPRPGRSSEEGNYMLPYPRPGRSQQSSLYENNDKEGDDKIEFESSLQELKRLKRSTENYDLKLTIPIAKEFSESTNSDLEQAVTANEFSKNGYKSNVSKDIIDILLKNIKDSETHNKPSYILPYPRPGRDI